MASFAGLERDNMKKLRGRAFSSTQDRHLFNRKFEGTGKYVRNLSMCVVRR